MSEWGNESPITRTARHRPAPHHYLIASPPHRPTNQTAPPTPLFAPPFYPTPPRHTVTPLTPRTPTDICRNFYNLGWVSGTGGGMAIKYGNHATTLAPHKTDHPTKSPIN